MSGHSIVAIRRNRTLREALDEEEETYVCSSILAPRVKKKRKHGGSEPGKAANIARAFSTANEQLLRRYFTENPLYDDKTYACRYRMPKLLFMRVHDTLVTRYPYFRHVAALEEEDEYCKCAGRGKL
ncbi:hypothetical protein PC122_g19785 [Phytophthora cactorum]|nr:hypothetical protein PC122_g19785 [Phytophthora cactorum]